MHTGTKENLVDDDLLLENDQCSFSLITQVFNFTTKRTLQCTVCRYLTISFDESRIIFIYPSPNTNITNMLHGSMTSTLTKTCHCCHANSKHDETINIEQSPAVLVLVINRFDPTMTLKNKDKIILERSIMVSSNRYNIIGSIHHHGKKVTSGHYTSNIYYADSVYTCNDSHILHCTHSEPSDSVYMIFYARHDDFTAFSEDGNILP